MINYDDIIKLFAVEHKDTTYMAALKATFNKFVDLCNGNGVSQDTIEKIKYVCFYIEKIVESQEKGLHSTAFSKLANLFGGTRKYNDLHTIIPYSTLEANTSLYRIRINASKNKFTYEDMFHIPLDKKGLVATQRYSSPGYPCLYTGESIYGCWEEMHRYDFDLCMVSRLENVEPLELLDLRIPSKADFEAADEIFLLRLPLIMACTVVVRNPDDVYKPEYVLSQLITEWVITNNNNNDFNKKHKREHDKIYGIRYSSSLLTDEFEFPKNKLDNIVFFVLEPTSENKYCPVLSKKFKITDSTCNEYEKLKRGYDINGGEYGIDDENLKLELNYDFSDFGNLEKRLSDTEKFPLHSL